MENDHDWAARRYRQEASNLWGSEGGSIDHWNAFNNAQNLQRLADEQRAAEAAATEARASAGAPSWPSSIFEPGPVSLHVGSYAATSRYALRDDSQLGLIFRKLFKWILLPLLVLVAVVAGLWWGVREADGAWLERDPNGGVTRYATAQVFTGQQLMPAAIYLSPKEEATALQGPALMAALRAVKRPFAAGDPRHTRILSSAYRCQVAASCRTAIARNAPELQLSMLNLAVMYLVTKARVGNELAARDGCLLPLLTWSTPQAVFLGRNACAMMASANPASAEAHVHLAKIDDAGWFKFARVVAAERS